MALLRVGQLHVELLETGLGDGAALLQIVDLGVDLGQVDLDLRLSRARLFGELLLAQRFDLQRVGIGLGLGRLAAQLQQLLRGLRVGRFTARQSLSRLLAHQQLRAQLPVKLFYFLRPRQQTRLFRIRRIKTDAVGRHRVACRHINGLAFSQLGALRQRVLKRRGRVAAAQPVAQHRSLPGLAYPYQIRQPGKDGRALCGPGLRRAEEA